MANTPYVVPLTPIGRTQAILSGVANHAVSWSQKYNATLVSIVNDGTNVTYTFSNPLPQAEIDAIRNSA